MPILPQPVAAPTMAAAGPLVVLRDVPQAAQAGRILRRVDPGEGDAPGGERGLQQADRAQPVLLDRQGGIAPVLPDHEEGRHLGVERDRLQRIDHGEQAVVLDHHGRAPAGHVQAGIDADGLVLGTGQDESVAVVGLKMGDRRTKVRVRHAQDVGRAEIADGSRQALSVD